MSVVWSTSEVLTLTGMLVSGGLVILFSSLAIQWRLGRATQDGDEKLRSEMKAGFGERKASTDGIHSRMDDLLNSLPNTYVPRLELQAHFDAINSTLKKLEEGHKEILKTQREISLSIKQGNS